MRTLLRTTAVIGLAIVVLRELQTRDSQVSSERVSLVRPGMSKDEVYAILGPPRTRHSLVMPGYTADKWRYEVNFRGRRVSAIVLFCDGLMDWSIRDFYGLTIKRRKAKNYVYHPAH